MAVLHVRVDGVPCGLKQVQGSGAHHDWPEGARHIGCRRLVLASSLRACYAAAFAWTPSKKPTVIYLGYCPAEGQRGNDEACYANWFGRGITLPNLFQSLTERVGLLSINLP